MKPRKILYLVLCILSIAYMAILCIDIIRDKTAWDPDFGWFEDVLYYTVRFGGVALIFCYALCFVQGQLGVICFIVFCVFMVLYVIVMCLPNAFYDLFSSNEEVVTEAIKTIMSLKI